MRPEEPLATIIERAQLNSRRAFCTARFPGRCPLCKLPIVKGEAIAVRSGTPATHAACHRAAIISQEPST